MVPVPRQTRQRRSRPVQVLRAPSPLQLGHLTRLMGMAYVPFSAQVWEKPLMTQVTSPWTVCTTGVWPR